MEVGWSAYQAGDRRSGLTDRSRTRASRILASPTPRLFVGSGLDRLQDVAGRRGAAFVEGDSACLVDADDGPLDAGTVRLDRVVGGRDSAVFVDEEVEGEVEFLDEGQVAGRVVRVDAKGDGVCFAEPVDRLADGGQLVRSAGGHVLRVEEKDDALLPREIRELNFVAAGAASGEARGLVADLWHGCLRSELASDRRGSPAPKAIEAWIARAAAGSTGPHFTGPKPPRPPRPGRRPSRSCRTSPHAGSSPEPGRRTAPRWRADRRAGTRRGRRTFRARR